MRVSIQQVLYCGTDADVDLPEGKTWEDVKEFYVKWDTLHYCIDDEWLEHVLDSNMDDIVDWKRPSSVSVYAYHTSEDGEPSDEIDFDIDLAD